jgi:hypothetical protein
LSSGHTADKTMKAPFTSPEPPIPVIDRPIINILELVATPDIKEPNSKKQRKVRKTF